MYIIASVMSMLENNRGCSRLPLFSKYMICGTEKKWTFFVGAHDQRAEDKGPVLRASAAQSGKRSQRGFGWIQCQDSCCDGMDSSCPACRSHRLIFNVFNSHYVGIDAGASNDASVVNYVNNMVDEFVRLHVVETIVENLQEPLLFKLKQFDIR